LGNIRPFLQADLREVRACGIMQGPAPMIIVDPMLENIRRGSVSQIDGALEGEIGGVCHGCDESPSFPKGMGSSLASVGALRDGARLPGVEVVDDRRAEVCKRREGPGRDGVCCPPGGRKTAVLASRGWATSGPRRQENVQA